jgi:hypothetical protein
VSLSIGRVNCLEHGFTNSTVPATGPREELGFIGPRGISRIGDAMVPAMLYEAANVLLSRTMRFSALKRWGLAVAKRRGMKRAKVAAYSALGARPANIPVQ